jgi:hypothetical protein
VPSVPPLVRYLRPSCLSPSLLQSLFNMAQITFFATDQDCDDLWGFLFAEMQLNASPDPWFGEPPAPLMKTRNDVVVNLDQYPRVAPGLSYFLTSPVWSPEPLVFSHQSTNPNFAPHWYVRPRHGGPSIHFLPSFAYPWHKRPDELIAGAFFDYPCYYSVADPDQGKVIERPDGLTQAMKAIRRRLLSRGGKSVRAASRHRAIAMRHAVSAHQQGTILRQGDILFASSSHT